MGAKEGGREGWHKGGGVWEGVGGGGRDKMGKVNRFINYGRGAASKVGGDLSYHHPTGLSLAKPPSIQQFWTK